jgi:pilus assembly protein CpaF
MLLLEKEKSGFFKKKKAIRRQIQDENSLDGILLNYLDRGKVDYQPLVSESFLQLIRDDLNETQYELLTRAFSDEKAVLELTQFVRNNYQVYLSGDIDINAEYVIREIIGTGFFEEITAHPAITDVGWNGTHLSIRTNLESRLIPGHDLGIDNRMVERVAAKFAARNQKSFNRSEPILEGMYGNIRLSALHEIISPAGIALSLRVTRKSFALNEENFEEFAPIYMLDLFKKMMETRANIVISGETGSGKTELQKLLLNLSRKQDRILMIEDTQETHLKELLPDHDIVEMISKEIETSQLIKASLRQFPKWIVVSETRGAEAKDLMDAFMSGHNTVTTVHSPDAHAIPARYVAMCMGATAVPAEMLLDNVNRYVDFGIHIEVIEIEGRIYRYLSEMVEFSPKEVRTIFKQVLTAEGEFLIEHGELSAAFKERLMKRGFCFEWPSESGE